MKWCLVAVEPTPEGDWSTLVAEMLRSGGYSAEGSSRRVVVWKYALREHDITYADGAFVTRLWIGQQRSALAVDGHRLYFDASGRRLDDRVERDILAGRQRPTAPPVAHRLEQQWAVLDAIRDGLGAQAYRPVDLDPVLTGWPEGLAMTIGDNQIGVGESIGGAYRRFGFDDVPVGFAVAVCAEDGVGHNVASAFASALEEAAASCRTVVRARVWTRAKIEDRLNTLVDTGNRPEPGTCVLVLMRGKTEQPLPQTLALFGALERAGVPFRRAFADDPVAYSIPDQLPSILRGAGGRSYRVRSAGGGGPVWTVGLDLGHRPDRSTSVVAMTLVDPDGGLVKAWTSTQRRDETPGRVLLSSLLEGCAAELKALDPAAQVVVLRDGRLFEREDASVYPKYFGRMSLFEYRKRANPQIVSQAKPGAPITHPAAALVPGTTTMFVTSTAPRTTSDLASVAKVSWRRPWNGLALEAHEVATLLVASALAPGLGLRPHKHPAAIYWADGIAGASDDDLRFCGQPVVRI